LLQKAHSIISNSHGNVHKIENWSATYWLKEQLN